MAAYLGSYGTAETAESKESAPAGPESQPEASSNILIAYFTMPEDVDAGGVDAVSGAKEFLRQCTFDTPYLYMIITYGHDVSDAPEFTARLAAEEWGLRVDYIAPILMVDNFLPVFDINEETAMEKHEDQQLEAALQNVLARKKYIPEATEEGRELHRRVAKMQKAAGILPVSPLKIEKSCNGCGLCQKVCPAQNISIEGGKAKHGKNCEFCLACANLCPQKAVRPRMADKNPDARYRNPHITLEEIIQSNK